MKEGGERGWMGKRRGGGALPAPPTLLRGWLWMGHPVDISPVSTLLRSSCSLSSPHRVPCRAAQHSVGLQIILTIIWRIYPAAKGDWSFNTPARERW